MPFITRREFNQEQQIFNFSHGNIVTANVQVDDTKISANANGEKLISAGTFVADVAGTLRFLPRAKVTTAFATNATTGVVTPSQVFVAGDELYIVEPYAIITPTGTVAVDDTATVTIDNKAVTVTATTTTLSDLTALIVTALNTSVLTKDLVFAKNIGNAIYIFAKDGISTYTIATADTGSGLSVPITGSATRLAYGAAIGTVSDVAPSTGTITLTGNAAIAVPVGANIGVRVTSVIGLDNHDREFNYAPVQHFGVYGASDGVKENLLPYIDGDLKRRFNRINFGTKF